MIIVSPIAQVVRLLIATHRNRRDERAIAALSPELRKDIGWPDLLREDGRPGRGL